jgi:predicted porin
MKKIALVAALAALSSAAFAQSSVNIYGRLNATVESQKVGTGDRKAVVANNASRIGFKGTEDLGGGLKASFVLEHGFNVDTGTATGNMWNRESSVQLAGAFGAVRLGNWTPGSYFATADYVSMHNHDTGSSEDKLYSGNGWATTNKVAYFTPTVNGFNAELAVSLGEGAQKRAYDLAANYQAGALHLGAGYAKRGDVNQFAVRGLYEMGAFTVGGYYQRADDGATTRDIYRLAGMYVVGASEFHLNYGNAEKYTAAGSASQYTLGYNYNLSKRTKVYGYYTAVNAKTDASDFSSIAAGIRHNF